MSFQIADCNEFHPLTDGVAYSRFSPVCITRVTYSTTHVDRQFSSAVDQMNRGNVACRGFYAYVVATADARAQGVFFARSLLSKIGVLRASDFISWDIEEGAGDQSVRAQQFMEGVHKVITENPKQDFGYSGASFWTAHLSSVNNVHRWIAAYGQSNPPPLGEALWQNTETQSVPGIEGPCDCSIFQGTLQEFQALIGVSTPTPPNQQEDDMAIRIFGANTPGQPTIAMIDGTAFNVPDQVDLQALASATGAQVIHVDAAFVQELQKKL